MPDDSASAEVGALIDELMAQTAAAEAAGEIDLLSALLDRARDYEVEPAQDGGR